MSKNKNTFPLCFFLFLISCAIAPSTFAADVETLGDLKVSGIIDNTGGDGITFPDGSTQASACSGCANGILSVTLGGTGAITATGARTSLGAAAAGANSDIHSIAGLTTPLSLSQGGTGSSAKNFADLSTAQTVGGAKTFSSRIGSTVATGTAPLQVASTTMVTNLNAEMVGGQRLADLNALYQKKYTRVAVVEPYGHGDYTNPAAAMAAFASWCGTPSQINPCLLKIMPGFYDITTPSTVQMQPYIDVEGSGEKVTIISGTTDAWNGVIKGGSDAEIRFLTIENRGGSGHYYSVALGNGGGTSPKITNVTATASGGTYTIGVYNDTSSSPKMTNVTANGSGGTNNYGVFNNNSSPTMTNMTATASGGTNNYGVENSSSSPTMTNVTATAWGGTLSVGVHNIVSSSPTMTNVTAKGSEGANNYGVYNTYYSSLPTMTNMTATASGGTNSYGVYNDCTSPTMTSVTVTASGGTANNYGVYNSESISPTMNNVTVTASGGTNSFGIYNIHASPIMSTVKITASGGSVYNYGIFNDASSTASLMNVTSNATGGVDSFGILNTSTGASMAIDHSRLSGQRSIRNDNSSASIFIGASKLNGDVLGSAGTIKCMGVYSGSYTAVTCP